MERGPDAKVFPGSGVVFRSSIRHDLGDGGRVLHLAEDDPSDPGRIERKDVPGEPFGFFPAAGDIHFVDQGDNARAGGACF